MDEHIQPQQQPQPRLPKVSIHSGNGNLRGGGVRPIHGRAGLTASAGKLERRIGPVMCVCMASIATALLIHGLFHETLRPTMVKFIGELEQEIRALQQHEFGVLADEIAASTVEPTSTTTTMTMTTTAVANETSTMAALVAVAETATTTEEAMTTKEETTTTSTTTTATTTTTMAESTTAAESTTMAAAAATTEAIAASSSSSEAATEGTTSNAPNATDDSETLVAQRDARNAGTPEMVRTIRHRQEQLAELDAFRGRFSEVDRVLWALVLLNVLGLVILVPATCLFRTRTNYRGGKFRLVYRVLLIVFAVIFIIQMVYLISPMLTSSFHFPSIVDKLFGPYLQEVPEDRRAPLVEPVEDEFSCKLEVHELLERYGLQEKCIPKMKDRLLAPYIVVFLIFVCLFPFLFAVFTHMWALRLKDWEPVKKARRRVEMNQGEGRPQSREQILSKTLGTSNGHGLDQQQWAEKKAFY